MDRKLTVEFHANRSVEYRFERSDRSLVTYTIEHPAEKVELVFADVGYEVSITPQGWLRLTWRDNRASGWSRVHYRKREKLAPIVCEGKELLSYNENITIKAETHFGLWLGSPFGPLSAVRGRSSAIFKSVKGAVSHFEPRQLAEFVFRSSGTLQVSWVLEALAGS